MVIIGAVAGLAILPILIATCKHKPRTWSNPQLSTQHRNHDAGTTLFRTQLNVSARKIEEKNEIGTNFDASRKVIDDDDNIYSLPVDTYMSNAESQYVYYTGVSRKDIPSPKFGNSAGSQATDEFLPPPFPTYLKTCPAEKAGNAAGINRISNDGNGSRNSQTYYYNDPSILPKYVIREPFNDPEKTAKVDRVYPLHTHSPFIVNSDRQKLLKENSYQSPPQSPAAMTMVNPLFNEDQQPFNLKRITRNQNETQTFGTPLSHKVCPLVNFIGVRNIENLGVNKQRSITHLDSSRKLTEHAEDRRRSLNAARNPRFPAAKPGELGIGRSITDLQLENRNTTSLIEMDWQTSSIY